MITFYNDNIKPFIAKFCNENIKNAKKDKILKISQEIEKLFNVAEMTSLFRPTNSNVPNQINESSRVTISFKTIKNKIEEKIPENGEDLNNTSFLNESTVSSAEFSKNPNEPEKISDYCKIQIKAQANPLISPEFDNEEEVEGDTIIYRTNKKQEKEITFISINLFLKKIITEENFFNTHSNLIFGFIQQYNAFISLDILIKKIINVYEYYTSRKLFVLKMKNLVKFTNTIIIQLYDQIQSKEEIKSQLTFFYSKMPKTDTTRSIIYLLSSNCEKFDVEYLDFLSHPLPHSSPNVFIRESRQNKPSSPKYFSIFDYDEETIASQLTYITRSLISNIKENEIISAKFAKKNKNTSSPNVLKVIKRFDDLIFFIIEEILSYDKSKVRALVIEKWINVAVICKQMNNFNDCMIITTALLNFIIKKLSKTWKKVRDEYNNTLKQLKVFCTCEVCYKNIRKAIEDCVKRKLPFIPYLGILLKDISFYEEKYRYIEQDKLVNFDKIIKVSNAIAKFNQFHNFVYSCRPNKALNLFNNLNPLGEAELENLSFRLEPTFNLYEEKSIIKRKTRTDLFNYNLKPLPIGFLVTIKDANFIIQENFYKY